MTFILVYEDLENMYQCCGYHFNYYTLLLAFYFCNFKIILYVVIYCIYCGKYNIFTNNYPRLFLFLEMSQLRLVKGMAACWMTRGLNSGRHSVLCHSSDSLSPTHPLTHWVQDPTVECLEVE